jgi:hypothetical protein
MGAFDHASPENRKVVRPRGSQMARSRLPAPWNLPRGRPHRAGDGRVRSGQAPAWPLASDRSARRDSGVKRLRMYVHQALFTCARCPAVTVTLDAGGAGTDTQRAIPGPEPSHDSSTFRPQRALVSRLGSCPRRRCHVRAEHLEHIRDGHHVIHDDLGIALAATARARRAGPPQGQSLPRERRTRWRAAAPP